MVLPPVLSPVYFELRTTIDSDSLSYKRFLAKQLRFPDAGNTKVQQPEQLVVVL
jgi:hypothetical protein